MESVSKITIISLKMMVKSGLEKFILKSLHTVRWLLNLLGILRETPPFYEVK
jgi:hypothetical protein